MANQTYDNYGDQFTDAIAVGHSPVNPRYGNGTRRIPFTYTAPVGNEADGNNVGVVMQLKAGTVLWGGLVKTTALGTGADVDVGLFGTNGDGTYDGTTSNDDDVLGVALDCAAISSVEFGNTIALKYGYVLLVDCDLVLTVDTAVWEAGEQIMGYIEVSNGQ